MKEYDHNKIEKKWQKFWDLKKTYKTESGTKKKKFYVLDMFPYPSGAGLHVGHPRGYVGSDIYARLKRMQGFNVLHPMGYDAFGLPAEQYAIEHKIHPRKAVEKNIKTFRGQLDKIGFSFDWSRQVNTTDPEYYKWTQWIFLQIYNSYYDETKTLRFPQGRARPISELIKKLEKSDKNFKKLSEIEKEKILMNYRLAYEGYSEVNWCPKLGTVLANDEIVDDKDGNPVSERGGYPVEKKLMRQWFMRITAYADRLVSDLEDLNWPQHIKEIQKNWIGREEINGKIVYKMRDAIFARQRYWGEPIPLIHKKDGTIVSVPEKKLPLVLPSVKSYEPAGTGESPLAGVASWVKEGYETNTMPGWAGSSWYFLRYADPKNKKEFASKKNLKYWMGGLPRDGGVDMYVGGQEHATGHLLYSRFWHKFLYDTGHVPTQEPFKTLKNQGLIMASDGRKMSKRWGNVINPDDIVKTYGADTLRVYEMFMGPFDETVAWSTESIIGSRRFIEKVWRVGEKVLAKPMKNSSSLTLLGLPSGAHTHQNSSSASLQKLLHKTIKKVTEDIEAMRFNTAISAMMILASEMEKAENINIEEYKKFLQILAPFAPHVAEELWFTMGERSESKGGSIHLSKWPKYDDKLIIDEDVKIAVQINGKVRAEIEIPVEMKESDVFDLAINNEIIKKWIEGKNIIKKIYVKGRLVNIVIS